MNKLMYVEKDEDQVYLLKDNENNIDVIYQLVRSLFDRGVKFVGLETETMKIYFDSDRNAGNKAIAGKFKERTFVR